MNCQDVEVPASNRQEVYPENGQTECASCHCLEPFQCPTCQNCKRCGKWVPIRFWEGTLVPRPYPFNPLPYPVKETDPPFWVEPNTTITTIGEYVPPDFNC